MRLLSGDITEISSRVTYLYNRGWRKRPCGKRDAFRFKSLMTKLLFPFQYCAYVHDTQTISRNLFPAALHTLPKMVWKAVTRDFIELRAPRLPTMVDIDYNSSFNNCAGIWWLLREKFKHQHSKRPNIRCAGWLGILYILSWEKKLWRLPADTAMLQGWCKCIKVLAIQTGKPKVCKYSMFLLID